MLGENMIMAFHAIMANKMRSFLTMLGIILGIGSVISIVSIGDTMRGLFADLYKDAGATQAVVSIGYNVEDVRDSDYFTLDELDKIKEIFGDEISYIAGTSGQKLLEGAHLFFVDTDYRIHVCIPVDCGPEGLSHRVFRSEKFSGTLLLYHHIFLSSKDISFV